MRKGMLTQVISDGRVVHGEVDVTKLGTQDKKQLIDSILKVVEEDNEKFLSRLKARTDRVGIDNPKIKGRFENLSIEGNAYVGSRALLTLLNTTINAFEVLIGLIGLSPSKRRVVNILQNLSGVVRPSRMTLLLRPPGAGKTNLLQALAGKLQDDLRDGAWELVPGMTCWQSCQESRREKEASIKPDPEIDAYMKATSMVGQGLKKPI